MKIREGYWREKATKRVVITRIVQGHAMYFYEDDPDDALGHRVKEGWTQEFEWIGKASDLPTKKKAGL